MIAACMNKLRYSTSITAFLVSLLILALALSGCDAPATPLETAPAETSAPTATTKPSPEPTATSEATETPTKPTDTPGPTSTPQPYGPDEFPEGINPLTGLSVADPNSLNRRPIGIKVNIFPREQYRPTWGLSLADIVFDFYHNNGYSRFHAILYGSDFRADRGDPLRAPAGRGPGADVQEHLRLRSGLKRSMLSSGIQTLPTGWCGKVAKVSALPLLSTRFAVTNPAVLATCWRVRCWCTSLSRKKASTTRLRT